MTVVNLLANIVTPHYPTLHMVGTPMMAEQSLKVLLQKSQEIPLNRR